jgi:eukaryotic-like serine/threonine-protein kinase
MQPENYSPRVRNTSFLKRFAKMRGVQGHPLTTDTNSSDLVGTTVSGLRLVKDGLHAYRRGILMDRLLDEVWSDAGLNGKYVFEQRIASSAMAVVVIARHLELDERVAIKFLSPDALRSSTAVTRFRREAKAAAKIKSQHVVRVIDVANTATGVPYIVMEYLEGKDLERLLSEFLDRQAPVADAVDFVLQASEAVAEGHSLGIVHRDLKPANLFCVDRGDGYPMIKVLDFGISKFTKRLGEGDRTDRHEILGSPRYMSPEQIESPSNVDHRSDIWSLGVILYEAIAGHPPFDDDLILGLWRKIRDDPALSLVTLRQDCPAELWEVVSKCLQKTPEKRFADLGEFAKALVPFAPERSRACIARIRWTVDETKQGVTHPSLFSDSYDRVTTNPKRRRYRWVIAGSIASTVGIGLSLIPMRRASHTVDLRPSPSNRISNDRAPEPQPSVSARLDENPVPNATASASASVAGVAAAPRSPPLQSTSKPTASRSAEQHAPLAPRSSAPAREVARATSPPSATASSAHPNDTPTNQTLWPMAPVTERK